MTGDSNLLSQLVKYTGPNISFGDNSKGKSLGKVKLIHGNFTFNDVLLVENLKYNLISISQLCDNGFSVQFDKHSCSVKRSTEEIILTGKRCGNTYKVSWNDQPYAPVCLIASKSSKNWL